MNNYHVLRDEETEASGGGGSAPPARDTEIEALKAQMADRDAKFNMLVSSMQNAAQQQPQPQQTPQSVEDLNKQIWQNPSAMVDQIASVRAQQIAQQMVGNAMSQDHETMVSVARSQAREEAGDMTDLFDRYRSEIESIVGQNQPQYHRNVNVWRAARDRVFGMHARELRATAKEEREKDKPKAPAFRIGDGPAPPSAPRDPKQPRGEVDPMVKVLAQKLDIDEERMADGVEKYNSQYRTIEGALGDPNHPSPWDPYISFNEKTGPLGRRLKAERERRSA